MISIKDQESLFVQIGNKLSKEITVYAIGGTAMMFLGFKESTLDVDLVFAKQEEREEFKKVAKSLGYREMDSKLVYGLREGLEIIALGDARLDLFVRDVIDFVFSKTMEGRARQIHQFGKNLILKIADVHDIIIMKCATRRLKDKDDIIKIFENYEIDWDIFVKEIQEQVRLGKVSAILNLGNLLEDLRKKQGIDVPNGILEELWGLLKRQAEEKIGE